MVNCIMRNGKHSNWWSTCSEPFDDKMKLSKYVMICLENYYKLVYCGKGMGTGIDVLLTSERAELFRIFSSEEFYKLRP